MTDTLVRTCAALGDPTRWEVLSALGEEEASASTLASRLPVSRQAIAKHLAVLLDVGLVEQIPVGREVRYRPVGWRLGETAQRLERIGHEWERRLHAIKRIAEDL